jgi:hypothetical protein
VETANKPTYATTQKSIFARFGSTADTEADHFTFSIKCIHHPIQAKPDEVHAPVLLERTDTHAVEGNQQGAFTGHTFDEV